MPRTRNSFYDFKQMRDGLYQRSQYRKANKKHIDIIRDIEMLKIKLIDIENFLDGIDIFGIVQYLDLLSYNSNLDNLIIKKPDRENFWMTIWKYQEHCSESEIIVKISYRRSTTNYNPRTDYSESTDVYSPCVYTELNLLMYYFTDYIFPILMSKNRNIINPLSFKT